MRRAILIAVCTSVATFILGATQTFSGRIGPIVMAVGVLFFGLAIWLFTPLCLAESIGVLSTGLYRDKDDWVMVRYGKHDAPMSRADYETRGYSPPFEKLPTKEEYDAANGGQS
jgi:hypothetical protein